MRTQLVHALRWNNIIKDPLIPYNSALEISVVTNGR